MPDADVSGVLVRPCPEPKFGDYQSNALMGLAKRNQLNPRELAAQVVEQLDVADCCEPVKIAGPGFLNFRLRPDAVNVALAGTMSPQQALDLAVVEVNEVLADYL